MFWQKYNLLIATLFSNLQSSTQSQVMQTKWLEYVYTTAIFDCQECKVILHEPNHLGMFFAMKSSSKQELYGNR